MREVNISHYVTQIAFFTRLLDEAKRPRRWWQSAVDPDHIKELESTIAFYNKQLDDTIEIKIRDAIFADRRDRYI